LVRIIQTNTIAQMEAPPVNLRLFLLMLCPLTIILGTQTAYSQSGKKLIYAVFWRGCEELCNGIKDYVAKNIPADIVIRNAERDKSNLPGFLKEARSMKADLILTWGTSVTLGMAGTLDELNNPNFNNTIAQVFTVVADPVGARVVASLKNTGRNNITGTFNRVPEAVNIATIRSYRPTFKRLGLLYNKNEPNSVLKKEELIALADTLKFEITAVELELDSNGKPNSSDIPVKLAKLKEANVDFIYLGSSSFLTANSDIFTGSAVELGIPVLSPYERLVRNSHALLSISARYYDVGILAGKQIAKILVDGKNPGDLPVARMTDFAYVINMEVARKLNLFPPVEVLQIAETVK
jgi:putative ABC transport system substrate-binding protein